MFQQKQKKEITILFPFRAFHNQQFNVRVLTFFLLPPVFNIIIFIFMDNITNAWGQVADFFLTRMGFDHSVIYLTYTFLGKSLTLPAITLSADAPSVLSWWLILIITAILFFCSFFISDAFTPLKYLFRAVLFLIATALVYFFFWPASFPYDIELYSRTGFAQDLALLFAVPWIFGFTYYMFSYKYLKKILVTIGVLFYFIVFAPFQYLLSSYLIHVSSLLFMPALYIFFGLWTSIFAIIAFYAYGVSLEQVFPELKIRKF